MEPPSIRLKKLGELAEVTVDPTIPLKIYVRSLWNLKQQGYTYLKEKNYEKAYILLLKLSILLIEKLPKHKDYKTVPLSRLDLDEFRNKNAEQVLDSVGTIKKQLQETYANEHEIWKRHLGKDALSSG
eukprot:Colp12_sorted_trinity150504_noHs@27919